MFWLASSFRSGGRRPERRKELRRRSGGVKARCWGQLTCPLKMFPAGARCFRSQILHIWADHLEWTGRGAELLRSSRA